MPKRNCEFCDIPGSDDEHDLQPVKTGNAHLHRGDHELDAQHAALHVVTPQHRTLDPARDERVRFQGVVERRPVIVRGRSGLANEVCNNLARQYGREVFAFYNRQCYGKLVGVSWR
jgi:hypothetical protein